MSARDQSPAAVAQAVWNQMREDGLVFDDILRVCAVLAFGVEKNAGATPDEVVLVLEHYIDQLRETSRPASDPLPPVPRTVAVPDNFQK